jgi:hypothetical protein
VVATFPLEFCSRQCNWRFTRCSRSCCSHRRPRLVSLRSLLLVIAQPLRIRTGDIATRVIRRIIEAIIRSWSGSLSCRGVRSGVGCGGSYQVRATFVLVLEDSHCKFCLVVD